MNKDQEKTQVQNAQNPSNSNNADSFYAENGNYNYGTPKRISDEDYDDDENYEEDDADNDVDEDDIDADVSDEDEEESEEEVEEESEKENDSQKEEKEKEEETSKESPKETESKPQNRDRNHEEAEKRRKAAEEESRKKLEREKYLEGFKAATGGVNPFTNEEIKSEEDVKECEIMQDLKKRGLDPILDYYKGVKERNAKEKAELEAKITEEEKTKQYIQNDIAEFKKNNPNVDLQKLFNDPKFDKYKQKLNGRNTLQDMYDLFNDAQGEIEKTKVEKTDMSEARKKSSVGNLNSGGEKSDGKIPTEELKKMTREQIRKEWAKITKSYN